MDGGGPSSRGLPPAGTPAAEVAVDADLVRGLLAEQHPDLAPLPLTPAASGWDNATFRLGDDLAVRLPRRALAATLVEHEQRWLPGIAARVPVPVPAPVRVGVPGRTYPWRWSVVPWFAGASADVAAIDPAEAPVLGRFLAALHVPAAADAPPNPYRGIPLADGPARAMAQRLARLDGGAAVPDLSGARAVWEAGLAAPPADERRWLHGDLHPRNVLVDEDGLITAVIDWGDLTAGDVATDLASAWLLFDADARAALFDAYGDASAETRARARAWAAYFAVVLLDVGLADDPAFLTVARATLARLAAPTTLA